MQNIDGKERYELDNAHQYNVTLSPGTSKRQIIADKSIYDLDTPGNVNYAHIYCHFARIQMQILLEQVLASQNSDAPQPVIDILDAQQNDKWSIKSVH